MMQHTTRADLPRKCFPARPWSKSGSLLVFFSSKFRFFVLCRCGVHRLNVSSIPGLQSPGSIFSNVVFTSCLTNLVILSQYLSSFIPIPFAIVVGNPVFVLNSMGHTHMLACLRWAKVLFCFWRRHCDSWRHHTEDIPWVPLLWAAEIQVGTFCRQAALRAKEISFEGRKTQSVGQPSLFFFSEEVLLHCPRLPYCLAGSPQTVGENKPFLLGTYEKQVIQLLNQK